MFYVLEAKKKKKNPTKTKQAKNAEKQGVWFREPSAYPAEKKLKEK